MSTKERLLKGVAADTPPAQYLDAERTMQEMAMSSGRQLLDASTSVAS
jgi:hypothetical protein